MNIMSIPIIKPYNKDKFGCKQSKYDVMSKLPVKSLIVAPSNSGKSILLQNMILDIYRGCFEKVYIFSPSIHIDGVWAPEKQYLKDELEQVETDRDRYYFDTFDQAEFTKIITTQAKIVKHMKDKGFKNIYNIAFIIDDF